MRDKEIDEDRLKHPDYFSHELTYRDDRLCASNRSTEIEQGFKVTVHAIKCN